MRGNYKLFLSFFFFLVSFGIFSFADTSSAAVCSYRTRNPTTGQLVSNPAYAQYQNLDGGQGVPFCQNVADAASCDNLCGDRRAVIDCTFHAVNSCGDFSNQFIQREAPRQQARDDARKAADERNAAEAVELSGKCLCSLNDPNAPLTPLPGATPDSCFDRNPQSGDGRSDATGESLYNCRWVLNEDVNSTMDKNQNELSALDAKIARERNPLENYKGQIQGLNKLRATSVQGFLGAVIKMATGIMGTIALSIMIYGGVLWLTSMGNSSQVEKAQQVLFWGALGIFVILGSYALVNFIFEAVNPANSTIPPNPPPTP